MKMAVLGMEHKILRKTIKKVFQRLVQLCTVRDEWRKKILALVAHIGDEFKEEESWELVINYIT